MIALAFDTSSKAGSVAVANGREVLASASWIREGSHAELLVPEVEKILKKTSLEFSDIDRIVVTHGPGSFTGVRVAVNCARAWSYTHQIPVVALNTDESLILPSSIEGPVVYFANAHQRLGFFSVWTRQNDNWLTPQPLHTVEAAKLAELVPAQFFAVGDGWQDPTLDVPTSLRRTPDIAFPQAELFGRYVSTNPDRFPTLAWNQVLPLYLRAPGAEKR